MTETLFDFSSATDLTDVFEPDGTDVGLRFVVAETRILVAAYVRMPDTLPGSNITISLWPDSSGSALLSESFAPSGAGAWTRYDLTTTFTLTPGTYRLTQRTTRYAATRNYAWPVTSGVLTGTSDNGWFHSGGGWPDTQSSNSANYHISPVASTAAEGGSLRTSSAKAAVRTSSAKATMSASSAVAAMTSTSEP